MVISHIPEMSLAAQAPAVTSDRPIRPAISDRYFIHSSLQQVECDLLVANGSERVDSRRAPRRQDAGGKRHADHHHNRAADVYRIRRSESEQQVRNKSEWSAGRR